MITIRPVKPEDAEGLRQINDTIFVDNPKFDDDVNPHYASTENAKEFFHKLTEQTEGYCFVAEVDGQLVGYTNGEEKYIPFCKSRYFEIDNLGVIPEQKGKGVGKQLMLSLMEWAKQHGFERVSVNCYIKNQEALDFYRRNGFTEVAIDLEKSL